MPSIGKAVFPLLVILVLVYLASQTLLPREPDRESATIAYGDLINRVETTPGSVVSVVFLPRSNGIEATLADGSVVTTHYPTEASQLRFQELLEQQGVRFDSKGRSQAGWWSIVTYVLPFVLFFGFWLFLMRKARGKPPGGDLRDG
jgi:ATP-dependent Zn protease